MGMPFAVIRLREQNQRTIRSNSPERPRFFAREEEGKRKDVMMDYEDAPTEPLGLELCVFAPDYEELFAIVEERRAIEDAS